MKGCQRRLKEAFSCALREAFPKLEEMEPIISLSSAKFGGDYQLNSAMTIYKKHGKELGMDSPKIVADHLAKHMKSEMFEPPSVSPQGFITVKLTSDWLVKELGDIFAPRMKIPNSTVPSHLLQIHTTKPSAQEKVIIDFSSPNFAKEMHVGHLRSSIIGESISRVLEYCGYSVERVNHIGDWGTQFGMLIEYLKDAEGSADSSLADLQTFYKLSKTKFDEDPEFKKRAQSRVVKLQGGDEDSLAMWRVICEESRKAFNEVYSRLNVTLTEKGESYYNALIPETAELLKKAGMVVEADGAQCVFVKGHKVPLMLIKSDGGYGYDSTDLAAVYYRLLKCSASWVIYVTDIGQEDHFKKLFLAATNIGWHIPGKTRLDHVGFGLVQGTEGKKFKTRSGEVVRLVDLLDEAASRAEAAIAERRGEDGELTGETLRKTGEAIGYSSVKYFDLKQNRSTNYKFSYDKMLEAKGNTGVYMLYAYARICAIFRKSDYSVDSLDSSKLKIEAEEERCLAVILVRLSDVVDLILTDLHIHRLAEYMYEVSDKFTTFYQNCKVVGDPQEKSRLLLCESTRKILEICFYLLGIRPLERI